MITFSNIRITARNRGMTPIDRKIYARFVWFTARVGEAEDIAFQQNCTYRDYPGFTWRECVRYGVDNGEGLYVPI